MDFLTTITLQHFLLLSAILFCLGLVIALTRRNILVILAGLILIFNSLAINFLALSSFHPKGKSFFSLFLVLFSTVELAVLFSLVSRLKTLEVDKME